LVTQYMLLGRLVGLQSFLEQEEKCCHERQTRNLRSSSCFCDGRWETKSASSYF
jgi:hypothetical protein